MSVLYLTCVYGSMHLSAPKMCGDIYIYIYSQTKNPILFSFFRIHIWGITKEVTNTHPPPLSIQSTPLNGHILKVPHIWQAHMAGVGEARIQPREGRCDGRILGCRSRNGKYLHCGVHRRHSPRKETHETRQLRIDCTKRFSLQHGHVHQQCNREVKKKI